MNYRILREIVNDNIDIEKELEKNSVDYKIISDEYRILCPFHTEKTPSCFISPELRLFHCFGCHTSGDLVYLFSKIEKYPIEEYVFQYARKLNLDKYPSSIDTYVKIKKQKEKLEQERRLKQEEYKYIHSRLCDLYRFLLVKCMEENGLSQYHSLLYDVENYLDYYEILMRKK